MHLATIEKRGDLTPEIFSKEYLTPQKPVIFTNLIDDWEAKNKWTWDYLRDNYGHIRVPLFDKSYSVPGPNYMKSCGEMLFGDYLTLIQHEPTDLRMFLFNIFKHAPELVNDIKTPNIMNGFIKEFPFMFFGGEGSYVKMHYDIDCSHVFLTQFQNRKKVTLFSPDQSKYLYHLPFTVASLVDMQDPNENKFPALKKLHGYEGIIGQGETLFIPSMYWHFIQYIEGGFSLSLRANESITRRVKGAINIARHFVVDKGLNLLMGERWHSIKEDIAFRRAG